MILGRGTAENDDAIMAEFHQLLTDAGHVTNSTSIISAHRTPFVMREQIGKPILEWNDEDLLALYQTHAPQNTITRCNTFLAFLLFRGYYRASIRLLASLPIKLSTQFRPVLAPYRAKLRTAFQLMGYRNVSAATRFNNDGVGSDLHLLLWCLAWAHKSAEELTRNDFDLLKAEYTSCYRGKHVRKGGRSNHILFRLEQLLISLKIIPAKTATIVHEPYFADFADSPLKQAMLSYLRWCDVKYSMKSQHMERRALACFLQWLGEHHPRCLALNEVSRSLALAYAGYLKLLGDEGKYSANYRYSLHRSVRLFFEFVVEEGLEGAPVRNPFSNNDIPKRPDMIPRYLPDSELKAILTYCETEATLLERTMTITLLHTGIRAGEFAVLKVSYMVQIAGVWKLHIHQGKGLKERVIPLTAKCVQVLQEWKQGGWQLT